MHMPNRMGNSVTAILIGALIGVALAVEATPLHAADSCLSGPKGAAPKGSHWYYRIDHATKKNCWYVRAEGGQVASPNSSVTQPSPQPGTSLQPSVANARAEATPADIGQSNVIAAVPAPSGAAEDGQDANGPGADNRQSTVASRWLDRSSADTSAPTPADSGATSNSSKPPAAEVPVAARQAPPAPHYSVQTLLLAIVGALALAALLVGAMFGFGSARRIDRPEIRRDRSAPWDSIHVDATTRSPPLAADASAPRIDAARQRHEAVIPNEIVQLLSKLSKEAAA
jgi:hypothetical protein